MEGLQQESAEVKMKPPPSGEERPGKSLQKEAFRTGSAPPVPRQRFHLVRQKIQIERQTSRQSDEERPVRGRQRRGGPIVFQQLEALLIGQAPEGESLRQPGQWGTPALAEPIQDGGRSSGQEPANPTVSAQDVPEGTRQKGLAQA
jgi:hypothetical protein